MQYHKNKKPCLDSTQIEEFKELIVEELLKIRSRASSNKDGLRLDPDDLLDHLDLARSRTEEMLSLQMKAREEDSIHRLEMALARIRAGTFGRCSDCGETIAHARLKVRLHATLCLDCQELRERVSAASPISRLIDKIGSCLSGHPFEEVLA